MCVLHLCFLEYSLLLEILLLIHPTLVTHPISGVILRCRPTSGFEGSILTLVKVKKNGKRVSKVYLSRMYLSCRDSWVLDPSIKRYHIHMNPCWPMDMHGGNLRDGIKQYSQL